ncbi:MAG: hypothetical protein COU66_03380 [Candidatus Pacebacteria bacterium CG10_big_fil_rev_8_21_14_0_10_44_11]|nr:MAG: hypothetical protein COU66_03380 [Candidatus Pacebacteria bacterium CG10_big_fil_rev_8_21_14_0_10_44_11]
MKLKKFKKIGVGLFFVAGLVAVTFYNQKSLSANLTSVSVTLSNSRPSFRGALAAGNTALSSLVIINTTPGSYSSTNSAQLVEGDTARIGEAGSLGSYTVTATGSADRFTVTPVLASGDSDTGDDVISSQSADLTVRFTTANAIANGRFRVLVPALTDNGASADGIPDGGYFDFGTSTPTVTCPSNATTTYDFVTGTATASVTYSGLDYHTFECAYSGTGAISTPFDASTNDAITISSLINPAPATSHTTGTADRYRVIVQHLDTSMQVTDSTVINIGVIEAVKVTAVVSPQITFRIIGVDAGASACGIVTSVASTPVVVPFNELLIDTFTYAAQTLTVSTNAVNGYAVTAIENDQLGINGDTCTGDPTVPTNTSCIQDSRGDDSAMSHTASDDWSLSSTKGFGFSLDDSNTSGLTPAFEYDTTGAACGGGIDCYRQFADAENAVTEDPQTIFQASSTADNHNLLVCYKAVIATQQAAGSYENYLTYTATATF